MIKFRLTVLSFFQFFIWGCWLITIGAYWFQNRQWDAQNFGVIFSTMGISALFMPAIIGVIADKYLSAERLYGLLHILGGICLFYIPTASSPDDMFWRILITMLFYMPTIALSNTVAYHILKKENLDVVKVFPPIRVWGTVGFIAALWTVSLTGNETQPFQFYLASIVSILLGIYSFTLPNCPPLGNQQSNKGLMSILGLDAIKLLKSKELALFFIFSMFLGAALQLTNAYGDAFLSDFKHIPAYQNSLTVKYPAIILSISQISETLFILTIPFFMKRFGIKQVMFFSMLAWVLRFGLFAMGNPGNGLWMIVSSCIIYGMAFDFFNISGSLFIETNIDPSMRSRAQGLFTMMVNGLGAVAGSAGSGYLISHYFEIEGQKQWPSIWWTFAGYAAFIAILFLALYKDKNPKVIHHTD